MREISHLSKHLIVVYSQVIAVEPLVLQNFGAIMFGCSHNEDSIVVMVIPTRIDRSICFDAERALSGLGIEDDLIARLELPLLILKLRRQQNVKTCNNLTCGNSVESCHALQWISTGIVTICFSRISLVYSSRGFSSRTIFPSSSPSSNHLTT